jgi:DNA-binding CsgD family transcriptional regulator
MVPGGARAGSFAGWRISSRGSQLLARLRPPLKAPPGGAAAALHRPWLLRGVMLATVLLATGVELLTPPEVTAGALVTVAVLVLAVSDAPRWTIAACLTAFIGCLAGLVGGHVGIWVAVLDCAAYAVATGVGLLMKSRGPSGDRGAAVAVTRYGTTSQPGPTSGSWNTLTWREDQVVGLVLQGLTSKEVGRRLYISERTVERHLEKVYGKLAIHGRGPLKRSFQAAVDQTSRVPSGSPT